MSLHSGHDQCSLLRVAGFDECVGSFFWLRPTWNEKGESMELAYMLLGFILFMLGFLMWLGRTDWE